MTEYPKLAPYTVIGKGVLGYFDGWLHCLVRDEGKDVVTHNGVEYHIHPVERAGMRPGRAEAIGCDPDLLVAGIRWIVLLPEPEADYGPDSPPCPRCKHYNALLYFPGDCEPGGQLKCRDCGYLTPLREETPVAVEEIVSYVVVSWDADPEPSDGAEGYAPHVIGIAPTLDLAMQMGDTNMREYAEYLNEGVEDESELILEAPVEWEKGTSPHGTDSRRWYGECETLTTMLKIQKIRNV